MKSVVMMFTAEPDLSRIAEAYGDIGSTDLQSPGRLVVEGDWGWFAVGIDRDLEGEFSDLERARIARLVAEPVYAQLEYSNSAAADLAIKLMPATAETLIDNDHGMLRSIAEVRDLICRGIKWQTNSV
ncbi:hypothetical protein EOS93_31100 [Rhizobium sp. RMa-01]|uniref:hypothetical protein n=1 Tax=unclassified Rhizobium TaxID=2613769 RepID=UPI000AD393EF|nr:MULTISPECIES: hypothetical protein [unclassified Rhizobium]RVU05272.1 hypothetical protein EOS93_31100 [Rhizobium sp. RMa-01]